jgi:hypothetical protein
MVVLARRKAEYRGRSSYDPALIPEFGVFSFPGNKFTPNFCVWRPG